ncbi:MAG: hypothetical protein ACYTAS_24725, partial [Planctomycetota bacterium]
KADWVYIKHVNFEWSWYNITRCWESDRPYVLQPMFYPTFNLGMDRERIQQALDKAALVHVNSQKEFEIMRSLKLSVDQGKVLLCPNGTSVIFHSKSSSMTRNEVITVSARSGDKNCDRVVEACRGKVPLTTFIESRPYHQMPMVYLQGRVFVNASSSERCSRTIAEALCSGCRVLATKHNWGDEWYPHLATFDPDEDFSELIRSAYETEEWDFRPNKAARGYTWEAQARLLKDAMERK